MRTRTRNRERKKREKRETKEGDDWVDGEGTKRIEQCVSSAEFIRLKRPQYWIRENLSAAILRDAQSVVENAMTSVAAASLPSAAEQAAQLMDRMVRHGAGRLRLRARRGSWA